ncbi:MAG: leucine-rich repeat domain-containing protein [Bacteroidales bacterium]|nr:leucine-rich repeat domain-containing protein [Bacteroidales bacterium]
MPKRSLFAIVALLAINLSASAYDFSDTLADGQVLYYTITPGGVTVAYPAWPYFHWNGYTKPSGNVVIPDSVSYGGTTYPVTAIGNRAFYECTDLVSVSIPSTVTDIAIYAFAASGLSSVTINAATIGQAAFYNCSNLTSVTFGNSVVSIGESAFRNCTGLSSITIPSSVTSIGSSAFGSCTGLTTVFFNADSITSTVNAFGGCRNITSFIFGNNVKIVPIKVCNFLTGLTNVVIPGSVSRINNEAFRGCTGLVSVSIPNAVTTIGLDAFFGCSGLRSVIIGDSVATIGVSAFAHCNNLETIIIHATTPPVISSDAFWGRYATANVYVPCASISAYQSDSLWGQFTHVSCGIVADVHPSNPLLGQTTGGGAYDTISDITLTAVPAYGSIFYGWNNGINDNPYSLHLTADTTIIALFYPADTSIVTVVHDSVFINLHDTTTVTEYVHDTTYVPVYDTTIVTVHDTTVVTEYVHDTTTVYVEVHDTVWLTEYIHDTVYIHDTIVVGVDEVDAINAKVYSSQGQIVVEGADGNTVTLYDLNGRYLATKQDYGTAIRFDVPATGTYMIKIGNHAARKVVVMW